MRDTFTISVARFIFTQEHSRRVEFIDDNEPDVIAKKISEHARG
jgi:hypothetical protein